MPGRPRRTNDAVGQGQLGFWDALRQTTACDRQSTASSWPEAASSTNTRCPSQEMSSGCPARVAATAPVAVSTTCALGPLTAGCSTRVVTVPGNCNDLTNGETRRRPPRHRLHPGAEPHARNRSIHRERVFGDNGFVVLHAATQDARASVRSVARHLGNNARRMARIDQEQVRWSFGDAAAVPVRLQRAQVSTVVGPRPSDAGPLSDQVALQVEDLAIAVVVRQ